MKNIKFSYEYESLIGTSTVSLYDKKFSLLPLENYTVETFQLCGRVLNRLVEKVLCPGIKSKGTIQVDDNIIYIEYTVKTDEDEEERQEVYKVSVLD